MLTTKIQNKAGKSFHLNQEICFKTVSWKSGFNTTPLSVMPPPRTQMTRGTSDAKYKPRISMWNHLYDWCTIYISWKRFDVPIFCFNWFSCRGWSRLHSSCLMPSSFKVEMHPLGIEGTGNLLVVSWSRGTPSSRPFEWDWMGCSIVLNSHFSYPHDSGNLYVLKANQSYHQTGPVSRASC